MMLSRRDLIQTFATTPIAITARSAMAKSNAGRKAQWVSRNGLVDGNPQSYFNFGTFDEAPQAWTAHNAGYPYSCELSDDFKKLRLELHAGDQWKDDAVTGVTVERTMVQAMIDIGSNTSRSLPLSTDVWWGFSFLIEPGSPITSLGAGYSWLIFADIHSDYRASHAHAVPIQFELLPDDFFAIEAHGSNLFPNNAPNYVYQSTRPIRRGVWHDVVTRINMDPANRSGFAGADVYLDGRQVLGYSGPIGFFGDLPYPQYQIYRDNPSPYSIPHEALAIRYANHEVVTRTSLKARISKPPRV